MKYYSQIIILLLLFEITGAQFYNTGQAPFSVKWMQLKTDNFQIIYPLGFYKEANRAANILEYMYDYAGEDMDRKPKKVSVLLYNQSTLSNGFVVWAPKRAEWITTPPLKTYPQDWLEQLAVHEFRHVVQIDKLEQGFTKVMKVIFGEMFVGAMTGFIPFWFLEGDATVSETALSSVGRGRQPDFSMELRAFEIENPRRYSYDQSYLGSYKHFIPDYYKYGYQMVSYGKLKYGSKFWSSTLNNVAKRPYTIAPFYFGLKKNGSTSKVKLYHDTFDSLKIFWNNYLDRDNESKTSYIYTAPTKFFTSYLHPQQTERGIFAVKTSIDDITRFVIINDSAETILHTPGRYYNSFVSVSKKYIAWEESVPDIRWQQRSFSVIKVFDIEKEKERMLSRKSRYFYPVISPGETQVACIEINENNRFSIIVLSLEDDRRVISIPFFNGENILALAWLNGTELVFISLENNNKLLKKIDLNTRKIELLYNSGLIDINHLIATDEYILFTHDTEIARNVYAYSLENVTIERVTEEKYGADYPSYDSSTGDIIYSAYTVSGYKPVRMDLTYSNKVPLSAIKTYKHAWAEDLSKQASVNIQKSEYPNQQFDPLPYRRFTHAINIHSWAPFYFDVDDFASYDPQIYPGATIMSQNKLSTVTSTVSYYYANGTHYFKPKITFQGLFPVFEFSALTGNNPGAINADPEIPFYGDVKNYYLFSARSYLPLNFSQNKYSRFFQPGIEYTHWNAYYLTDSTYNLGFDYLEFTLQGSRMLRKSNRDLYSRFGQTLYLSVNRPLRDPAEFGTKTFAILNLYFPGFFKHHSTRLYLAHEKNENKTFIFRPRVSLPRGYPLGNDRFIDIIRGTGEYTFPFLYPDWSIGPIAYIKRFHASVFCDAAIVKKSLANDHEIIEDDLMVSVGTTLAAEMNFLRFFVPFTPKLTVSYIPDQSNVDVGFSVSINSSIF